MKVSHIFYSIQGEGINCGKPAVFIRLYDCNLSCSFCDESKHKEDYQELSIDEIIDKINGFPSKFVVLTGGEPTLYDLNPLIKKLQHAGYFIAVETNGLNLENCRSADWVSFSPKDLISLKIPKRINEIKIVVNQNTKLQPILDLDKKTEIPILIQPESDYHKPIKENIRFCVELVKKHPFLQLSLQTQKLIDIP